MNQNRALYYDHGNILPINNCLTELSQSNTALYSSESRYVCNRDFTGFLITYLNYAGVIITFIWVSGVKVF